MTDPQNEILNAHKMLIFHSNKMIEVLEEREFFRVSIGTSIILFEIEKPTLYEHSKFHFGGSVMTGNYVNRK